jgi:hypothetical protein
MIIFGNDTKDDGDVLNVSVHIQYMIFLYSVDCAAGFYTKMC